MKTTEENWNSPSKIFAKTWMPDSPPKAVIALVHGLGEHLGRYDHVAEFFVKANYAVMAYDRSGHGKSEGKRGHSSKFANYLDEIDELVKKSSQISPNVFLYGHSMGALLCLNYIMDINKTVKAAVISGPPLKLAFEPPKIKLKAVGLFRKLLPGLTVANELDLNALSFNQENIENYKKDPLVHSKISFETAGGLFEATDYVNANAAKVKIPILLMHGEEDGICDVNGTKAFGALLGKQADMVLWTKMKHEIHNEDLQNKVLQTAVDWLDKKI